MYRPASALLYITRPSLSENTNMNSAAPPENSRLIFKSERIARAIPALSHCTCASVSSGTISSASADIRQAGKPSIGRTIP